MHETLGGQSQLDLQSVQADEIKVKPQGGSRWMAFAMMVPTRLWLVALHRSEKGFVDESWRRFLAYLPVARSVAELGYSFNRAEEEPCYIQPLLLDAAEPSDGKVEGMRR